MTKKLHPFLGAVAFLLWPVVAALAQGPAAWLDGDPGAIWRRPPGFYEDGGQWHAILHTRPDVARVQLAGDFTDGAARAVDLTRTPDGKFWWFKGEAARFARPPRAGDCYRFLLTRQGGTTQRIQDPAARRVESSGLAACSLATVGGAYAWRDASWQRPGWEYYLVY